VVKLNGASIDNVMFICNKELTQQQKNIAPHLYKKDHKTCIIFQEISFLLIIPSKLSFFWED